jgi:hypothetical protein
MYVITRVPHTNDNAPTAARTRPVTFGLGPNQLTWLRRNMDAFRHLEEQRYYAQQDAVRAARMAGLAS